MPEARFESAAASLNGFIYVCGGFNIDENVENLFRYNPETDEWKEMNSMERARGNPHLIACNNRLYAIGGYSMMWLRDATVEIYDPTTDQWSLPTKTFCYSERLWPAATEHDGKVYICGTDRFKVYSPETNTWQALTPLPNYNGQNLVSINGKLWAFGKGNPFPVSSYDIHTDQWSNEPEMIVRRGLPYFYKMFTVSNSV